MSSIQESLFAPDDKEEFSQTLSVSQLNNLLKNTLEKNPVLQFLSVSGEVSNFKVYSMGSSAYFTLKDADSAISCVMFGPAIAKLKFEMENDLKVVVKGKVSFFNKRGSLQLQVFTIEPEGKGALALAFEQLKEKLEKEGLFALENKKPIPKFSKTVGLITSPSGAAVHDMIKVLKRRAPYLKIILIPAIVQGADAPDSIADAIKSAQKINPSTGSGTIDVLIIGRGGGSIEELWAFNEEVVARAIANSKIPTVSAVGHEVDFTIADFVADLRAPTPSAAAEMITPDVRELIIQIESAVQEMGLTLIRRVDDYKNQFMMQIPMLNQNILNLVRHKKRATHSYLAQLEALSPLKVFTRGYSVTQNSTGQVIKSIEQVKEGELINTRFQDGQITSKIVEVNNK
jgi:exodeoxyribonuclease VII large subunit